ncbi:MAG: ACP S-malonyltransferase [Pseudomonadota bacterium]
MTKPLALLFPGQGTQKVGMGKDLADNFAAARQVFEEVDEALSQKLSALMFDGPQEELTLTTNAQPAIMACGVAAYRVLQEEAGLTLDPVVGLAGHSLGEYAAHTCAGSFDLTTAAKLLRIRSQAMLEAMPKGTGAMAALLGATLEEAEEIAEQSGSELANDNCPGQVVLSGLAPTIEEAIHLAKKAGKKAIKLEVSGAFHSSGMKPAQLRMEEALAEADVHDPVKPVVANFDYTLVMTAYEARRTLAEQVTGRVRWQDDIRVLREEGAQGFLELGAGRVVSGLLRKIDRGLETANFGEASDMDAARALIGN